MMFKNILMLVLLSVAAIMFQTQLLGILHVITKIHDQIASGLGMIFSVSVAGEIVQSVISLLLIPAVIGVVFSVAHVFIKQEHFPHTLTVVWVSWAVLLAAILVGEGHVSNDVIARSPKPLPEAQVEHAADKADKTDKAAPQKTADKKVENQPNPTDQSQSAQNNPSDQPLETVQPIKS